MHLLSVQAAALGDSQEPVDIGHSPADVIIISAADTELAGLSAARAELADRAPDLRLASLMHFSHPFTVDNYLQQSALHSKLVVVRVLGGKAYWSYGLEQFSSRLQAANIAFAALPGDDKPDEDLRQASTVSDEDYAALWAYFVEGGFENYQHLLQYAGALLDGGDKPPAARALLRTGVYVPGEGVSDLHKLQQTYWRPGQPVAAIVFYRALVQGAGLQPVNNLVKLLLRQGLNPLPVFVASLKDELSADSLRQLFAAAPPAIVINGTSFAVSTPQTGIGAAQGTVLDEPGVPVLQIVFSSGGFEQWDENPNGLSARDIAMNVALPEIDGRVFTRIVSFKREAYYDEACQCPIVSYHSAGGDAGFVAELAARWVRLAQKPAGERKLAMILANYPNRDGRLANGVGLDTPASALHVMQQLAQAGYKLGDLPADAQALMERILAAPTNWLTDRASRAGGERLSLALYERYFNELGLAPREQIIARWGPPASDPFIDGDAFALSILRFGHLVLGIQPARGYNIDPRDSYHDPDLVPPHNYLAFYFWLRHTFEVDAIIHLGKHGNLEWLPGKALALSADCYPMAALGPLPHFYPFIVNDPGEGAQAKRRTHASIIDHLTPPLARAETYGPLKDIEALVDEYYQASSSDPRRLKHLAERILALTSAERLDEDMGLDLQADLQTKLNVIDTFLCDLKESQIRDGLHVFGQSPPPDLADALIVALTRLPRQRMHAGDQSLIRALAADLQLGESFDPLDCAFGEVWQGPKPDILQRQSDDLWRSNGDTVERLELLALQLVQGQNPIGGNLSRDAAFLSLPPLGGRLGWGGVSESEPDDTIRNSLRSCSFDSPAHLNPPPAEGRRLRRAGSKLAQMGHAPDPAWVQTTEVLEEIDSHIRPAVEQCGKAEMQGLLRGLAGGFIAPGPSGAPTRGRLDVLPTGRNFYSLDSRTLPTPTAYNLGENSAALLIERHLQDEGDWPRAMTLSMWGTANMRTGGDDIAQALALMGVRPSWDYGSYRVTGYEIIPLAKLGRPRVDVTIRISGFFRDAFPAQIELMDEAARAIMQLDEPPEQNPAASRYRRDKETKGEGAGARIFGSKPGAYGAGLQALIDERLWEDSSDFAEAYLQWGSYAYGGKQAGAPARDLFEQRLKDSDAVIHNQDNREHDLLDSDDYYQFEGGLAASIEHLQGKTPKIYHNDHSRPERPVIRTLEEEISRVMRARVANPKWISGMMRHGYKGAFEMAATLDYLFAFAATTKAVKNHHFDMVYREFVDDEERAAFIQAHNPAAFDDIRGRLREAIERDLWQPRSNSARGDLLG